MTSRVPSPSTRLIQVRDVWALCWLWDEPRSIMDAVRHGIYPSYKVASRRFLQLLKVALLKNPTQARVRGRLGRPKAWFQTDRVMMADKLDEFPELQEWIEKSRETWRLPSDWRERVRLGKSLG